MSDLDLTIRDQCIIDQSTGCWNWTGFITDEGYGRFYFRGKNWVAHRFVYLWYVKRVDPELVIDHLCKNRRCVNPDPWKPSHNN